MAGVDPFADDLEDLREETDDEDEGDAEVLSGDERSRQTSMNDSDFVVSPPRRRQCPSARGGRAARGEQDEPKWQRTNRGWTAIRGGDNIAEERMAEFVGEYGRKHAPGRGYT